MGGSDGSEVWEELGRKPVAIAIRDSSSSTNDPPPEAGGVDNNVPEKRVEIWNG